MLEYFVCITVGIEMVQMFKLMPSLFFGQGLLGKKEKWHHWNKNCSRVMCWTQLAQVGNADISWSGICDLRSVGTGVFIWRTEYQICPRQYRSQHTCGLVTCFPQLNYSTKIWFRLACVVENCGWDCDTVTIGLRGRRGFVSKVIGNPFGRLNSENVA
jgi:hypothetical protein